MIDRFGLEHTTASVAAVSAFEEAARAVAAHRPNAGPAIAVALDADPEMIAAHALRGLANVTLGREELIPVARAAYAAAQEACRAKGGGSRGEQALVEALRRAIAGNFGSAAACLEAHLAENPRCLLAFKLAHGLRFMVGDSGGMLATSTRAVAAWGTDGPGYGFVLGCHAFGLEERGDMAAAEQFGRLAVRHEPTDAWGLHAVSHVHEMQGRVGDGIAWLEGSRPIWSACNNFSFHMAWHLALFHLSRGEHARVLALYDAEVRPQPTDDFRDVANATSLLWRLRQEGVDVGRRWDELREIALRRRTDTTLTFAALHNLLALVATGETEGARDLVDAMRLDAATGSRDQAGVMRTVGVDLARTILDLATRGGRVLAFDRLARKLPTIGGSHAQRDVFIRTLAQIASEKGDGRALGQVLGARRRLKRDDGFAARCLAQIIPRTPALALQVA